MTRKADLLEEADQKPAPKKQKKDGKAITVVSDGESKPDIKTLESKCMSRAETKDIQALAKENNELQATVQMNIAAMKIVSSENKELEDDNLEKSRTIQKLKDEFLLQEDEISSNRAKYKDTKAKLQDIKLKYENNLIALKDAASKQEDTEAELKDTVSQLEKSRRNEQNLQRQIRTLEDKVKGWELEAGQANHASLATVALSTHGLAAQIEDRFNRLENAMVELAKKQQAGFDAITEELSKKDNYWFGQKPCRLSNKYLLRVKDFEKINSTKDKDIAKADVKLAQNFDEIKKHMPDNAKNKVYPVCEDRGSGNK
ncbi:uncharacterized protein FFB20_11470 [Fusarium fujikuroi]|uniref:Uncharacterized protein n=1 Tax=Gibberella fujikuroi (strain CBS 195.34 / IMI 58289 / NRRL A-6831) TaxID=1279085 RepID=S0DMT0_GIBF5|nr:uncharacterized protein FFUJ_00748 [Fusarium fujikuroi IMI 58289]KLO79435.1 uncharacterized protein LW93_2803 [Fusarium fujikuroi]KLO83379.1 uncharacterized protein Y057_14584 [Fusarium fujikuroi]KLP17749.1 uncharacterized protein LW94_568 [Fusarium fujikuroi]QGI59147.1 hypothetical protein CEK27_001272 [Fusarium fujikuroi]QGI76359.1 hypothetical protein CEK25_001265 [Fusarium fujikuroi]